MHRVKIENPQNVLRFEARLIPRRDVVGADREMNGQPPPGGHMLACTEDYYADRGLWGISHIVRFRLPWEDPASPATVKVE